MRKLLRVSLNYFTAMKKKLLVILGPTSTGKTDLALFLAKRVNGELISADSRQVYKYLDIGTGKMPSNESGVMNQELRARGYWILGGVKIWMYDVLNPGQRFNLYQYIFKAEETIRKISESGKLPILVGGTGLYIRSLIEGVSDLGIGEVSSLRLELEGSDISQLRKKIDVLNPEILKNLNNSEINNKRRLIRILEKLLSAPSGKSHPGLGADYDVLKIGLKADKGILDNKIKKRVTARIKQGMINESKHLLDKKILTFHRMEELGLEYRYIARFLKGEIRTEEELINILSLKIAQYAKRQMTWFKKEKMVEWFDIENDDLFDKVETRVLNWYNINNE